jgi:rsbT co-antagonist protein RsbR
VPTKGKLSDVLTKRDAEIISQWLENQGKGSKRISAAEQGETTRTSREFMAALKHATKEGEVSDISGPEWARVKEILTNLSSNRAKAGYTPAETASFVFSMKEPIFSVLMAEYQDAKVLGEAIWEATQLLDSLGLLTTEIFQKTREEVISRQQQELLELSTPVIRLWENVLALPLIGTLDSQRTQIVMQNLLEALVSTRSDFAIIDITGVPVVDTLVAQHLLKTVAAARLMGAECVISGIRPQIAQTIIHLGVDLANVITKATLADAFAIALKRNGQSVVRTKFLARAERAGVAEA